ncbi:hypothetical protein [Streptomyces sp. Isolate_219]|uniref:hypothetical protein n=1 Tax=Streptomyces sp. Isolate_219 TaxID=2950110 RepID=UPI0021C56F8D|nr:hypothetical protein [Streptomyces sp. Isolate_219]MCR8573557.1 hypothetical protein [Streptomyces sp. Isolate_219]
MSTEPGTASSLGHELGKKILAAAEQVNDRQGLLDYLEVASSASSALHYGLANAAWRGQLSPGPSSSDRPPMTDLTKLLTSVEGATHPGQVAFQHCLRDAMTAAKCAGEAANTAWFAGMTKVTREGVDEANGQRAKKISEQTQDLLEEVMRAVQSAVPAHLMEAVDLAVHKQLEERRRKRETPAP